MEKESNKFVRISPRTGKPVRPYNSSKPKKEWQNKEHVEEGRRGSNTHQVAMEMKDVRKEYEMPLYGNPNVKKIQPGDNSRFLRMARVTSGLEPIDISDARQVEKRINEYFDFCEANDKKPNLVGIARWLDVSRSTLGRWKRGEARGEEHAQTINKAIMVLEDLWIEYMQNGNINPVSGIFLGKVMFGYRETNEFVFKNENDHTMTPEEIARSLPEENPIYAESEIIMDDPDDWGLD